MQLYSVIKNDGPGNVLAWKFQGEDFNTGSQLIVAESEEAIFVKDGIAEQIFDGGKYTLSTNNYPFISSLRSFMSDGVSAFNCKVYFINKAHRLELLWGTDSPIQLRDPVWKLQTSIRARGSYSIRVSDSKKFLIKLIGNNIQYFTQEELNGYFRSAFLQYIKDKIAKVIVDSGREILDIVNEKTIIASALAPVLNEILDEYGVGLVNFYINDISIPDNDPYFEKLNKSIADKSIMKILGEDWGRQTSANILGDLAINPGAGGAAAAGAGIGMGIGAASVFGNMATEIFKPMSQSGQQQSALPPQTNQTGAIFIQKSAAIPSNIVECPLCKTKNTQGAKFCNECGALTSQLQQVKQVGANAIKEKAYLATAPPKILTSEPITDHVHFSITAPSTMMPGNLYILKVWAHIEKQLQIVVRQAKRERSDIYIESTSGGLVVRGTRISAYLAIPNFFIPDCQNSISWVGEVSKATFPVKVPEGLKHGEYFGNVTFYVEGLLIAKLYFAIKVTSYESDIEKIMTRAMRVRSAFASYASEDRDQVLERIQGMKKLRPDLDLFIDVVTLRSGEYWKGRLLDEISRRDIFYLFWSSAASRSSFVDWEWRTALDKRGMDFIDPVPLDSPDKVPPPKELADQLHFNDWILAFKRTKNE